MQQSLTDHFLTPPTLKILFFKTNDIITANKDEYKRKDVNQFSLLVWKTKILNSKQDQKRCLYSCILSSSQNLSLLVHIDYLPIIDFKTLSGFSLGEYNVGVWGIGIARIQTPSI